MSLPALPRGRLDEEARHPGKTQAHLQRVFLAVEIAQVEHAIAAKLQCIRLLAVGVTGVLNGQLHMVVELLQFDPALPGQGCSLEATRMKVVGGRG